MSKIKEFPRVRKDRDYAYIRLDGRKIQLGKWNSPEAEKAYRQLQAVWAANPTAASMKRGETVLLDQLCLAFLQGRGDNKNDHGNYKTAIEVLLSVYSGESAESFDFSRLEVVRNQFLQRGYSRTHINKLTGMVRGIFYWGVPRKLVPASVAESIRYLKPLKKHQTTAPENAPRQEVLVLIRTVGLKNEQNRHDLDSPDQDWRLSRLPSGNAGPAQQYFRTGALYQLFATGNGKEP